MLEQFVDQYIKTALWSTTDDKGINFDKNYSKEDFSEDSLKKAKEDCKCFIEKAGYLLDQFKDKTRAAHLFWLDRNGHGTGFWDEPILCKKDQHALSEIADSFGQITITVNNDGYLEFM